MPAPKFATAEQHQALAAEVQAHALALERLSIRLEVVSHDTTHLLREVAAIREDMLTRDELRAELRDVREEFRSALAETRDEVLRVVREGHAALLSAVLQLGKKP